MTKHECLHMVSSSIGVVMVVLVVSIAFMAKIEPVQATCGPYVSNLCVLGGNSSACDAYCKSCHPRFGILCTSSNCIFCTNCTSGYCFGTWCFCNSPCSSTCSTTSTSPAPSPSAIMSSPTPSPTTSPAPA